ncbi:hypothetical protein lerEdw1_015622, partial [Lerista edwardsae]
MAEGRHCQVQLLDDRKLELLVQPKLLSQELLDLVASHFNLKEKEYFGITFIDDTGQNIWLQLDHRVLDHDLPKKPGPATLYFAVRFYIESISFLKDKTTVELFFLNAKSCVHKVITNVAHSLPFHARHQAVNMHLIQSCGLAYGHLHHWWLIVKDGARYMVASRHHTTVNIAVGQRKISYLFYWDGTGGR